MARPTKYKPEYAKLAKTACNLMGATMQEVADMLEVDLSTLNRWRLKHEELRIAITLGKEVADQRVEQSLYHKAMGYSHQETKVFVNLGEVVKVEVMKFYPPSDTACIFWLKNRMPEVWRDTKDIIFDSIMNDEEILTRVDGILLKAMERAAPEQKLDS